MSHMGKIVALSAAQMAVAQAGGGNVLAFPRPGIIRPRRRMFTKDGLTFDQMTIDSTGTFLNSELERLDPTLHMPLTSVSWSRDVDLRSDVTIADEATSFTNSSFAAPGGMTNGGKAWIAAQSNAIPNIMIDIGKTMKPLHLWGMEMSWTIIELERSQKLGRPIDDQKLKGLKLKHQMDTDEQVYIGDAVKGATGLVNYAGITPTNVVNGAGGTPQWSTKTPDEILADVNTVLRGAWVNAAITIVPSELRLPPQQFADIAGRRVSQNSDTTILEFIREKNIAAVANNKPLNIQPIKWLTGRGAGGTDRMIAYTKDEEYVRFPMVPLAHTPLEYRSLWQITTYYGALGELEIVYPETVAYADGI